MGELLSLSEVPKTLNIRGPLWSAEIILIKASIKILIFNEIISLSIKQSLIVWLIPQIQAPSPL